MSKSSEVILASAGTGKTFRLAGTFLKLLFDGKMPDKILATTFTRKASGEILDRVLGWLALATGDKDELHDLRKATGCFDESIINEKTCEELLTRLVRNLDTFNVRTLDSFFVEAAKVYAFELGMSVGWTICEDVEDARLRSDALIELFATNKPEVLNNLLIGISEMSPMRSVHGGSLKLLKNSLDILRNSDKSAWEVIQPGKEMLSDSELASLQEAFSKLDIPKTGGGTPNKHFTKNHRLLADILAENSWPAFLSNSIVQNISKGEEKFARITIPEGWQNLLGCLIPHAKNMLLKRLHFRNQSLYEFLCLFQDSYHSLKHRSGSYRFEDFPKALAKEQKLADSKHSSFRLGRSIRHLLLDEFQDTSVTQWQVLQPIVERVIENRDKTSLFCVGDVKQSIYGWRDGEPRLLQELGERQDLYIETMEASWRSSQTVLDAVNLCFGNLSGNEALMGTDSSFLSEAEKWDETFNDHVSAKPKLLGKVVLRQNPAPGNADENRAMAFRIAADRAEELQEKHSGASIGILVRRNASGNRIIKLLQDRGIPASGEGGNPLTDSKTVLSVLALLHLADHPGDSAAAFHVGSSFLAQEYNLSTEAQSEEKLIKVAKRTRRETQEKGFGAWTEGILKLAEQNELSEWDRQRMQQFIDLAYSYETKAGLRCSEFVDFVREKKVENPNSAPIKVMTIHQSKGLEFDIVILPELGGGIPGTLKTLLTARPQSGSNLETVSFTASKALVSIHPILEKMYNAQKGFLFREQMCVLYVAMTRAKHHLEMIVPALKPNAAGDKKLNRNIGCLLRAAFPTELDSVEDVLWQSPTAKEEWRKGRKKVAQAPTQDSVCLQLKKFHTPRILPRRAPSTLTQTKHTVSKLFIPENTGAKLHGTLVHALFESVQWVNEFDKSDSELLDSLRGQAGSETEHKRALETFRGALACPEFENQLSLESWPGVSKDELEILIELPFRQVGKEKGEQYLVSGFIDRLVLRKGPSGTVLQAKIYDFKTDQLEEPESLERQRIHHEPQMAAYRDAVCAKYGLKEGSVSSHLLFTDLAKQHSNR